MAFPTSQLPLYAGIAPGADPADPGAWNFTEITSDVREAGGVEITVGRADEASQVDATRTRSTFDNGSGDYSRVNPTGAYFGELDKGSPVEYRVTRINDTFTRTVASGLGTDTDSGLAWTANSNYSVNGSAALGPLASANTTLTATLPDVAADDVEVSTVASLSAVTTGAAWVHMIILRYSDSSNFYRMHTEFGTGGVISVKIAKLVAGSVTDLTATTATSLTYTSGTRIRTRARALGATLQIRVWEDGDPEPTTWDLAVEDDDLTGQVVGLQEWRVVGNTNVGTLTATVDDYRADAIRASTPVPEWPVRWDMSGNNVTAPIVGAGILRRLSQGAAALRSPIYRQLIAQPLADYWPLEDGSDATAAASAVPLGNAAQVTDGSFGSADYPPGAAGALTLNTATTSRVRGRVTRWTLPTNGYAAMCYLRLGSAPGGTADMFEVHAAGTVVRWLVQVSAANITITGFDGGGAAVVGPSVNVHSLTLTEWFAIQIEAEEDGGGNVDWAVIWHQVGSETLFAPNGSYAGSADRIWYATVYAPVNSTVVSHLWAGDDLLEFVDTTFIRVSAGYAGETAGDRLVRLAREEGLPFRLFGSAASTAPMGIQRPATILDLFRECEAADQGILIEAGAGLGYMTRESRYNQTPVMTLDFASGHVAEPPEPTDDDQRLRNLIRLSRTGGSEATAQDDASIAKSGIYADELTVNLQSDNDLPDHASWRLSLGTFSDLRWPRIVLDLARNPDLIADWCRVRVGSRITISGPPSAVGLADLDLIVEGWTETLGAYSWRVVLACSPAAPWTVGVYDDAASLWDSASTTLKFLATTGATSITFRTSDVNDLWSTTEVPYDVIIAGQRSTVTAMGAASLSAGSYDQIATILRGVDGIVKELPAGSEIHLHTPSLWAL